MEPISSFYLLYLLWFFLLSGVVCFCSRHKHLLLTLLSLEYIMLNIFSLLVTQLAWSMSETYLTLVFLVFVVVEGSVGLSLLISVSRSHGGDQLKSFNLLW